MKKKILWLSHFIPYPPKGGMLIRSYNMIKQTGLGHDVDLIALGRTDTMAEMYATPEEGLQAAKKALSEYCSKVLFVPTSVGSGRFVKIAKALMCIVLDRPFAVQWFDERRFRKAVATALDENDYDIVHFDTVGLAQYLPNDIDIPAVMNHHNIESQMMQRRAENEPAGVRRAYFRYEAKKLDTYERSVLRRFRLHLTCSELDSERLLNSVPELTVTEVPNGVDTDLLVPDNKYEKGDVRLVFVGGLNWYPNRDAIDFFATVVWPLLLERMPAIHFDLVGRGSSELKQSLENAGEQFLSHGFVNEIEPIVGAAMVYVCPIRDGGGTKLKLLDAMALGKAVVAHPNAVEGVNVDDGVHVLLATTESEFVHQIERVIGDDNLRSQLEKNARALVVDQYSYDSIGSSLRKLFSTISSGPNQSDGT